MIKGHDAFGFPGGIEKRYLVGTRKLNDAVTVCLFTGDRTAGPSRIWTGNILKGIYLVGALEEGTDSFVPVFEKKDAFGRPIDEVSDITQWYKDTDWLGDVVRWDGEPKTQTLFTVKEECIPILLRRLISRPDGEVDLERLKI